VGLTILGLVTFSVFGLIFGLIVQMLWDWLMPAIFHLPKINYWQAFGIIILGKLIFGSFGHDGHHHRPHFPRHFHHLHHSHCQNGWDDAKSKNKGHWKNWEHYEDWWSKEGKAAFENYIDRTVTPVDGEKNENSR
jgi:hypothetical protein